jgi:hypothetical protein
MKNPQSPNPPTATKPPLCFPDTDVPLACLFIHFEHGYTTNQFLRDFPSVPEEQVRILLEWVIEIFKNPNLMTSVLIELSDKEEEG